MEGEKQNKLIPNSTQIPNILLDFIIPQLPEAEGKCLLYIARRTFGFHKDKDRISLSQFIEGIKNRDGKRLDYGAGVGRASVCGALKILIRVGIVLVEKDTKGNFYQINLDFSVDKDVEKEVKKVVQKVNQFKKETRSSSQCRPKQVHILNIQKKGKKGNKDVIIKDLENDDRATINPEGLKKFREIKKPLIAKMSLCSGK